MRTSTDARSRSPSQRQNSSTSVRYARRVVSANAGESRNFSAAACAFMRPTVFDVRQCVPVSHGAKVWVALATVYVIWGSTYLGIELAGETIPPLFAVAVRFIAAALLLAAFTYWRRGRRAFAMTLPQIGTAVLAGALLPGANAVLFVAEQHVATGLSALI